MALGGTHQNQIKACGFIKAKFELKSTEMVSYRILLVCMLGKLAQLQCVTGAI